MAQYYAVEASLNTKQSVARILFDCFETATESQLPLKQLRMIEESHCTMAVTTRCLRRLLDLIFYSSPNLTKQRSTSLADIAPVSLLRSLSPAAETFGYLHHVLVNYI